MAQRLALRSKGKQLGERIQKVADSHADSPDAFKRKANPQRKICEFINIPISVDRA